MGEGRCRMIHKANREERDPDETGRKRIKEKEKGEDMFGERGERKYNS